MAKIDLKFLDIAQEDITIKVNVFDGREIEIILDEKGKYSSIYLDKSTAIKFAKTLRTEINKIKEVTDV